MVSEDRLLKIESRPFDDTATREVGFLGATHRIVLAQGAAPHRIETIDADTGERQLIGEGDRPVLSPDGKKLAFVAPTKDLSGKELGLQIWVSDIAASSPSTTI